MADYYTQSSFFIEDFTKEELDTLMSLVDILALYQEDEPLVEHNFDEDELELIKGLAEEYNDSGSPALFTRESDAQVWVHSEDYFNGEYVAEIIQLWLNLIDSLGHISFEMVGTCSKPRVDGFGGAACVVPRSRQYWMNTSVFLEDTYKGLTQMPHHEHTQDWTDTTILGVLGDFLRVNPDVHGRYVDYIKQCKAFGEAEEQ